MQPKSFRVIINEKIDYYNELLKKAKIDSSPVTISRYEGMLEALTAIKWSYIDWKYN